MKNIILFFFLLVGPTVFLNAQKTESTIRMEKRWGISAKIGGIAFGGVAIDYFATPELNVELIYLPITGIGTNFSYHILGRKKEWSPYIGAGIGYYVFSFYTTSEFVNLYFPIGVNYIHKSGFNISVDLGLRRETSFGDGGSPTNHLFGSGKVGYRF